MADQKLDALVHFVIHECKENQFPLGSLHLNKMLWYIDMQSYQETGNPVTQETYVKRKFGPVPKTITTVLKKLKRQKKICIQRSGLKNAPNNIISLCDPDIHVLSEDEIKHAKNIIACLIKYSASDISYFTHDVIWKAASMGEEIPLYATLASGKCFYPSEDILNWAGEIIEGLEGKPPQRLAA